MCIYQQLIVGTFENFDLKFSFLSIFLFQDSASTITSGLHTNLMAGGRSMSTHARVPTLAGMPSPHTMMSKHGRNNFFMGTHQAAAMVTTHFL